MKAPDSPGDQHASARSRYGRRPAARRSPSRPLRGAGPPSAAGRWSHRARFPPGHGVSGAAGDRGVFRAGRRHGSLRVPRRRAATARPLPRPLAHRSRPDPGAGGPLLLSAAARRNRRSQAFNAGQHWHAWWLFGAHLVTADGVAGTRFAVWAPEAERVSVVGEFNRWDGRCHPMRCRGSSGVWELFIPGLGTGRALQVRDPQPLERGAAAEERPLRAPDGSPPVDGIRHCGAVRVMHGATPPGSRSARKDPGCTRRSRCTKSTSAPGGAARTAVS